MGSLASSKHQSIAGTKSAARLSPFPPPPKSVRVLSVFGEEPAGNFSEARSGQIARISSRPSWRVWLIGITVITGLAVATVIVARLWN